MCEDKVAIIIPMYNSEDTIEKVLINIENQTAKSNICKVLVVNDGSTDNSENIVRNYMNISELSIEIVNKHNGGVSSARNLGMKNAGSAEWIAFCDSDDLWELNKLQRQLEVIEQNPNIDCLGCAYNDELFTIGVRKIEELYQGSVKDICIKNFPQPSTVIMKKKIYDEMGGFDENQKYAEDGNYFLRVAAKYNLFYLPERLIQYGFGKRGFGVSGLSSNLKGMYLGNVKNLKDIVQLGYIDKGFYYKMRIFFFLKYCRRILITRLGVK